MHRFFVDRDNIGEKTISIVGDDYNHIKNVLRLNIGDQVSICDGNERDYIGIIKSFGEDYVDLDIVKSFRSEGESHLYLKIYQGLPKGDKMELIIQKCTEIGVSEIVPISTARSIVKLKDKKKIDKKLSRWSKIAESASKQSKRGKVPKIDRVISLREALDELDDELAIVLYEAEDMKSFKSVLKSFEGKKVSLFIGPEGGFGEEEIEDIRERGVEVVSLGKRILRTETAGMVSSSIVMYELGDLGVI